MLINFNHDETLNDSTALRKQKANENKLIESD